MSSEDIAMAGHYTIKKVKNQEYLYRISYDKQGKQKWEIIGNVKELNPKDPNLIKARAVLLLRETRPILEKYLSGSLDKARARSELVKLLDNL